ncbi:ATP-binding cassette, subfamily C, bacterial CydD [Pseudoalteromonas carrageenovora]|uniref:ATP-binding cassette, subfamily C, bacterial CydD n=1 Tax=Pseudoalteromonas carrageenovora IAM 12662 TaxID=1314868 RepID=A0A2K4XAV9_PSEVC|nr:thiol reductant ABC exporter subunit CydD [Pseudoalteromonas carrageenovora]MBE0383897.1 ATP-binding cassette, subfamily C, bacterial CydD [Pseudoalteromonas carrageenovora IAM 12662]QBJ72335.1 ATP-binding cassette, subfamily C, bacterial CydD [Pseudoalteromonas carrageenovora]GEB71381.1 cysteine/glutathione ABC transporter membrane protein/ATP-binding protein [Pseudoalteromonas carrageenovora]SOU41451.1 Cysteine ABC transporter ATP-binding protein [Pseudoalteromonas carrageenovora IAM 12662
MTTNPRLDRAQQQSLRAFLKLQSKPAAMWLKLSIALGTFNAILMIAGAYLLAQTIHNVMFEGESLAQVTHLLWPLAGIILLRALFLALSERLSAFAALKIKSAMRQTLLTKLTQLGPSYIEQHGQGATLNTLHDGVEALHDYYAKYLPGVAYSALIPIAILVVIFPTDYKAGLIFLLTAPLIPFFMILVGSKAEDLNQKRWKQLAVLGNYFFDRIQGLTQLKLFNATRTELKHIAKISDDFRHATLDVLKIAFLSSFALEFLATISVALVAVIIGFRLFFGTLDFATGFVVLLLAPEFYLPLRQLGSHYHARLQGISAAADMVTILNAPLPEQSQQNNAHVSEPINTISINNLNFTYPNSNEGIKNINLALPNKGLVALVGASGSGKSTLFDCILGFHPQVVGQISINDKPLDATNINTLQNKIAWIPQTPTLFYQSISDNIKIAKPDASQLELEQAAHQAGALDFINTLPNGFITLIGEQGEGLSGGQKQRIALARAFLKQAPILVLDEPTAHLDSQTEQLIQRAINDYAKTHLVLVIAHRLNTVKNANNIIVMQNGEVAQQGTYSHLAKQNGAFKTLLSTQVQGANND